MYGTSDNTSIIKLICLPNIFSLYIQSTHCSLPLSQRDYSESICSLYTKQLLKNNICTWHVM